MADGDTRRPGELHGAILLLDISARRPACRTRRLRTYLLRRACPPSSAKSAKMAPAFPTAVAVLVVMYFKTPRPRGFCAALVSPHPGPVPSQAEQHQQHQGRAVSNLLDISREEISGGAGKREEPWHGGVPGCAIHREQQQAHLLHNVSNCIYLGSTYQSGAFGFFVQV